MATIIPPIKSQGIKTKLVPWINDVALRSGIDVAKANWVEPFFGTGVVGLNSPLGGNFMVGDANPHIVNFYNGVLDGDITPAKMRAYLERESKLLSASGESGYAHYREVRERFNRLGDPFDFVFLSRAGFNGMMRFNRKGEWNVPFCKKPNRFSPAYISKICNQVDAVRRVVGSKKWEFAHRGFVETIAKAGKGDLVYCDPPYFGRYADYYNGWTEKDEETLFRALSATNAHFILSTWHHNEFRANEMIGRYWGRFNIVTREHFYHNGGRIENRHSVVEALVFNFELAEKPRQAARRVVQYDLFGCQPQEVCAATPA